MAAKPFVPASQLSKWFPTEFHLNGIAAVASISTDTRQSKINGLRVLWHTDRPGSGVRTYGITPDTRLCD